MTTLHLMVGLPGSGKTTLARRLELEHAALRLSVDDWHVRLFGMDYGDDLDPAALALHDARHGAIEALLWETAERALALRTSVILDFGFWSRAERDHFRAQARRLGVGFRMHYAEATEAQLLDRIRARNAALPPGTFHIPEAKLREWFVLFEPPGTEE